jgi:hypothetical protein
VVSNQRKKASDRSCPHREATASRSSSPEAVQTRSQRAAEEENVLATSHASLRREFEHERGDRVRRQRRGETPIFGGDWRELQQIFVRRRAVNLGLGWAHAQ